MKKLLLSAAFCLCLLSGKAQNKTTNLTPISFDKVVLKDHFWSSRMRLQKKVLVPVAFDRTEVGLEDLRRTANFLKGIKDELPSTSRFNTSDLYKVIEGAAYLLQLERDIELEKRIDNIAKIIGEAQESDGYIYPAHSTGSFKDAELWGGSGMGDKPYSWVVHSHELYNVGHLYEAAVAYYQATQKTNLLDIAEKSAQHINKVIFEGDPKYNGGKPVNQAPGHQEIELALVKLYKVTGKQLYLDMAKKFIDIRGVTYIPEGDGVMAPEYAQQHAPVREQSEAVGHSVRATYLYSAMSDIGTLTNDPSLNPALNNIWEDIVNTRMHITGGLGAIHGIEGFGPQYELPNKEAYNETCAAVGNVFFNHRMFLLHKDGKYMDVAEVALLNNVLAGVNLDGNKFFYVNPLESAGNVDRSHWFGTACCPTNIARLIPQISGMMYANEENEAYISFYTSSETKLPLRSGEVKISQTTNYPFDEKIRITVNPEKDGQQFAIKLRVPTWVNDQFVPGNLYNYIDENKKSWCVSVNGEKVKEAKVVKGFVSIDRKWQADDKVELYLPMPVRYSHAAKEVKADRGRVAITRGPLVYCAEGIDNKKELSRYYITNHRGKIKIEEGAKFSLPNIQVITGQIAKYLNKHGESNDTVLTLVPYYAWNNRGISTMNVWFAETPETVMETASVLPLEIESIQASYTHDQDNLLAIVNGKHPQHSFDTSIPRWTAYPQMNRTDTVDFAFEKPTDLKSVSIYWYDDKGGVQLPKSWNLEYKINGSEWKKFPLYSTDQYTMLKDQFNLVHSDGKSFIIDELRVNIQSQENSSVGILQIRFDIQ